MQEAKYGNRWYLPAGRVDPGESLTQAARRETLEEAGVEINFDGILRIEHTPVSGSLVRVRVFFLAHPRNEKPPKSNPDKHSLQAAWCSTADMAQLELRGEEVAEVIGAVKRGAVVAPMSLLTWEGAPWLPT